LLPMAQGRDVRGLEAAPARRVHYVGQGAPRTDPFPAAQLARAVGRAVRDVLARPRSPRRNASRAATSRPAARRCTPRAFPWPDAGLDPGGGRVASPELG